LQCRAKKREQEDLHNEAGEDEDYAEDKPKAKKARKPKEEVKISTELQDLWSVKEPSLLYRCARLGDSCCCRRVRFALLHCTLMPSHEQAVAGASYDGCRSSQAQGA